MTPTEVKEIMKRAWAANADILNLLYTTHAAANPLGRKAKRLAKRTLGPATMVCQQTQNNLSIRWSSMKLSAEEAGQAQHGACHHSVLHCSGEGCMSVWSKRTVLVPR